MFFFNHKLFFLISLRESVAVLSFFDKIGFLIIPIATTISTWIGILIFLYLLQKRNFLLLQKKLFKDIFKIIISSTIMVFALLFALKNYSSYLDYSYTYKSIYLLIIVGFVGIIYLLSCYLLGLLKIKNYKTN